MRTPALSRQAALLGCLLLHCPIALAGVAPAAPSPARLDSLTQRGRDLAFSERPREAEPLLNEAAALAEALADSGRLSEVLRWLSLSVDSQGRREEAGEICKRLLAIAQRRGDELNEGWARFGLGWQAEQEGRRAEALAAYQAALELFRTAGDSEGEIWAWNGMGSIHQQSGAYDEARTSYRTAMQRAAETGNITGELRALNNLGTIEFSVGDPARALEAFQRACELQTAQGRLREATLPAINVAICQTWMGRNAEAEAALTQHLERCRQEGWRDLEVRVRNQLAFVLRTQGRHVESARICRDLLASGAALPLRTRLSVALALSNALAEMDSAASALAVLDEMVRSVGEALTGEMWIRVHGTRARRLIDLERHGEALETLRKVDAEGTQLGLTTDRAATLAFLARAYRGLGERDSALAVLERARAAWEAERSVRANPEWRERHGLLGRYIYGDLAAELVQQADPLDRRAGVDAAFDRLQLFKARTLLERMHGPTDTPPADTPTIDLAGLQALLGPGELFLDCYVGDERSFLFAVTSAEATCVPLASREVLATRVDLYRRILENEAAGSSDIVRRTAAAVDSLLLANLGGIVEDRQRIVVAPDGPLHLVPFGLAEALAAAAAPRAWVRVPSATVFARVRTASTAPRGDRVLAIAGAQGSGGEPLRGAAQEVARLARIYRHVDTRLPESNEGTPDWRALEPYALLHFAAHARIFDQIPWQSRIELGQDDRFALEARQIAALRLQASLAVLSSCASAEGALISGEGVTGLTSALLAAGVPAVVATLWPVDDLVTAELMEHFYAALAQGATTGTALARAQAAVRREPVTAAPFYWAGFVLIGDDRTVLALPRRSRPAALPVAGAVALALAGLAALLLGSRRLPGGPARRRKACDF